MKDEIKEILDWLEREANERAHYTDVDSEDLKLLLDYITNLQEKYERMKENAEILSNGCNELEKRNEKAIEYIESNLDNTGWLEIGSQDVEVLLNTLQGKSDE